VIRYSNWWVPEPARRWWRHCVHLGSSTAALSFCHFLRRSTMSNFWNLLRVKYPDWTAVESRRYSSYKLYSYEKLLPIQRLSLSIFSCTLASCLMLDLLITDLYKRLFDSVTARIYSINRHDKPTVGQPLWMHDRRALSTIIELYIANRSVNSIVVRIPKDIIFTERKLKQITQPPLKYVVIPQKPQAKHKD